MNTLIAAGILALSFGASAFASEKNKTWDASDEAEHFATCSIRADVGHGTLN